VLLDFLKHGDEEFLLPEGNEGYDHLLDFYYYMRVQEEIPRKLRKSSFH
jgi:hypothetical protein